MFKRSNCTKFETETIKSSLWDYFDTFTLCAGDITVKSDNNQDVAFTNSALFSTFQTDINDLFKQNNSTKFETQSINQAFEIILTHLF